VASLEVVIGSVRTQSLVTEFTQNESPANSPHECIATLGDSGGALFAETSPGSGSWELAGIQFARGTLPEQPENTAIYTNDTFSVDLSFYREALLDVIRPCADGRDNDGDSLVDLADPGCLWEGDDSEVPACSDGIDNDWDGAADYPADADCQSTGDLFEALDADGDFVADGEDNCSEIANDDQRDTDADGWGNPCDPDYTGDGIVGGPDYIALVSAFGSLEGQAAYDEDIDADGDGAIGGPEYLLLSNLYGGPPGPSGLACAGSPPCP
jgi:hypothetical protein